MAFPLLMLPVQWSSACRCRYPAGVGSVRDGAGAAGPAWAAPGALLAGRGPVVVLVACCPPGGLLWALWAVLVPWCLPSSVQAVRGCVAVSAAVVVCCAAVDAVPPGRLLGAAADRWRVSWPVCCGPAMVQRGRGGLRLSLLPWIAAGAGSPPAVGPASARASSPSP